MDMVESGLSAHHPRTVSRGLKLQSGFIGLDSLYLVVEYPKRDVFDKWSKSVDDLYDIRLHQGISFNGMVVRRGLIGYRLSVWDGDARLLLTDRVDDMLVGSPAEGQGMGVMLQLGPKWLREYGDRSNQEFYLNVMGQLILFGLENPQSFPIRLNRVDINVDVLGLNVADFSTDEWRKNWIGFASKMNFHTGSKSRNLQGLSVGSSQGSVRFKVYDKLAESEQRGTSRFWRSVWGIDENEEIPVARFEWSIKCYEANFEGIQYFNQLTQENIHKLLNYVAFRWGRLCIPQEDDSNQTRWPVSPLWDALQKIIQVWHSNYGDIAQRNYDFHSDLSTAYLNSLAGWLAGSMVRVGLNDDEEKPVDLTEVLIYLQKQGLSLPEIGKRASDKWKVAAKLAGRELNG